MKKLEQKGAQEAAGENGKSWKGSGSGWRMFQHCEFGQGVFGGLSAVCLLSQRLSHL